MAAHHQVPASSSRAKKVDLQGQAADLNLLQEKIAISSDASQMEIELQSLLILNERDAHEAEDIFEIVKGVEEKIASLEQEIQLENDEAEKSITSLAQEDHEIYSQLKTEQNSLAKEVENTTTQLTVLEGGARKLEEELRLSSAKEEMLQLRQSLSQLNGNQIRGDERTGCKTSGYGRGASVAGGLCRGGRHGASDQESLGRNRKTTTYEESQSERGQKYRDLRKREQVMYEFLTSWENNCISEMDRLKDLETQITQTLNKIRRQSQESKQQSVMQLVPSISENSTAKEDYLVKEGELKKSRATVEGIAGEYHQK